MSKKQAKKKGQIIIRKIEDNHHASLIHPSELKPPELADTAVLLSENGKKGLPLHEDLHALTERHCEAVEAVLNDWALFALGLIEAAHKGDHNAFRKIHDAMRNGKKKHKTRPEIAGLMIATTKHGRMPTVDEIVSETKTMGSGAGFTSQQQVKRNLASLGFDVPSRRNGRPKKQ